MSKTEYDNCIYRKGPEKAVSGKKSLSADVFYPEFIVFREWTIIVNFVKFRTSPFRGKTHFPPEMSFPRKGPIYIIEVIVKSRLF